MTPGPGMFTVVNDETLGAAIAATKETLLYVAPGISKPVVEALAARLDSRPNLQATVIVDLDPEVYRLGYGTEEGLRALQVLAGRQHLELRQLAGVRIGLLVTDGQTLVYSPTPLLIEAGSTSESKPNAVELTGYRLSSKKVSIPNDLLLGEDKALKERLKNSFLLLQGAQAVKASIPEFDEETLEPVLDHKKQPKLVEWSEAHLGAQRKALYGQFLINVPRFGWIIMRRNRTAFDQQFCLLHKQSRLFAMPFESRWGI